MMMNSSNSTKAQTLAEPDLIKALVELANLRDDLVAFERFCKHWPGLAYVSADAPELSPIRDTTLPIKFWTIYERREKLRSIWEGEAFPWLREFLLPSDPPEEVRAKYIDRSSAEVQIGLLWDAPITLDWRRGQIVYDPRTEFQRAIYQLFRQSSRAKICGNSDCPAPYFFATKATQRYCSDKCAELFQREWKRRWWAEHGDQWRRSRRRSRRKSK
jgi:hypothetical protein